MTRWLVITETSCTDPERVEEYNEWYNQIHLPDMLSIPEVVKATRYENLEPTEGQGMYAAAYEVEADDVQMVIAEAIERSEQWAAEGRMSELMDITGVSSYKLTYSPSG
jgi:hypothetical protein